MGLWKDYNTRGIPGYKVPFTSHVFNKISNGALRSPRWFISVFVEQFTVKSADVFEREGPPQNSAEWALRYMEHLVTSPWLTWTSMNPHRWTPWQYG